MAALDLPILDRPHFEARFPRPLRRNTVTTLQINVGRVCNLACQHCHVESSPARTAPRENMSEETARKVLDWTLAQETIDSIDLTGGSPEMNPNYRWMVEAFVAAGLPVTTRCNPTIIEFRGWKTHEEYSWVPGFFAEHRLEVIASLPCYLEENVDRQRGSGAFEASVRGLLKLNAVGYGSDPRLPLNLVYNPVGPSLPPRQRNLEADYKRQLESRFGIVFNQLWTITNMPIQRWRRDLERSGELERYMLELIDAFNPETLSALMCRQLISIGPDGRVYDCDFNQALELPPRGLEDRFIWEVAVDELVDRDIVTGDHCYGCTAGAGSSCGGALV
jgi:radical SAM/Cys-rich protein